MRSKLKKTTKQTPGKETSPELAKIQKNIYRQAGLAGLTILLTIVILFAMTSAWYTNIVQTSGLVFQAEPWGFDGEIIVDETPIEAAPGDDGIVSLQVQNTSQGISALSVNVSKAGMDPEMQKRLFFYVDAHMTRDDEIMDRVYVNNFEGYTYTVFGNGLLTLTEQISNAPQLKWEWVYDVLGYYVMANPVRDADGKILRMNIQDYLRPIEYDFDEATIRYDTDAQGNQTVEILTVDGKTDLKQFLAELALKDGYGDTFDAYDLVYSQGEDAYFYKIDVDDEGNGVYAYLCDYAEVEANTIWDTAMGEKAYKLDNDTTLTEAAKAELLQELRHVATLSISAQRSESSVISVSTLSALNTAISEGYADVIQLSADISLSSTDPLVIPKNTRAMIDLNEHTIYGTNATGAIIYARQGSSLTMINGTIKGNGTGTGTVRGIETTGGEVIMSNVDVMDFDYGVYMGDHLVVENKANEVDSRVHLMGCEIDANWYGIFINGNGTSSQQKTQLIIEESVISGDGYGITGSGNANRSGTDIQIRKSKILQEPTNGGTGAAIFQPQANSTLTITEGSTIRGYTGIALKGGHASITDSTIEGYGSTALNPADYASGSGFADTADAVYIETNYGYEIRLDISGTSELTSIAGKSLQVYEADAENVYVQIAGGTFAEQQPSSYIAENSQQSQKDGKYVITEKTSG